ncbi:unnamed protein product [Mytilus edulis]|uniref:Uncharacterized protein n=1 Tax=Mytilus edulis TaxID=6550 RepID=A0A8S3UR56_MYTED|nr:unnamed protein product [Mytilus edulis]
MPRRRRPANNQAAPARNLRRRGPQLNENEQPPQRRRRNDQHVEVVQDLNMPNPVQPNLDNDIQVAAPVPQPIGEVDDTIVFDEPNMLPNINETDIFISQTVKEKIWQFQYIDLSIMHKSNFSSQFDKQSYLGLNEDDKKKFQFDIWQLGFSPIKVDILENMLTDYPNFSDATLLLDGFKQGFKLNYTGPRYSKEFDNLIVQMKKEGYA